MVVFLWIKKFTVHCLRDHNANGGFQTLFREVVKFSNRSKILKPPSRTIRMVLTGVIELSIAISMSEKSPKIILLYIKLFLILHMAKVPHFQMIFKK